MRLLLRGPGFARDGAFSPDGRWLAYAANDTGRFEVYVQAFPGPGAKYQISTEGGDSPNWTRGGAELVYPNGDKMMAVSIGSDGAALRVSTPTELFANPLFRTANGNPEYYDVTSDGQQFLIVSSTESQRTGTLTIVENWINEVKAHTATK